MHNDRAPVSNSNSVSVTFDIAMVNVMFEECGLVIVGEIQIQPNNSDCAEVALKRDSGFGRNCSCEYFPYKCPLKVP